jgi:hypothetical protein
MKPSATETCGTSGFRMHGTVTGRAAAVSVELPHDNELAFWHDTNDKHRLSFWGFDLLRWPNSDPYSFTIGDTETRRLRCSLTLSEQPLIKIVAASAGGPRLGTSQPSYAWLVIDDEQSMDDWSLSGECLAVRTFLSFVLGVRTPFFWRDRLSNEKRLSRVYYGWERAKADRTFIRQPLPLGFVPQAFDHWKGVGDALPSLFKSFLQLDTAYGIDWITSPLWYALDAYLDDQLALACVSIERFRSAHAVYSKANRQPQPAFWTEQQRVPIQRAVEAAIRDAAKETGFPKDKVEILVKKAGHLGEMPNANKLSSAFEAVGLRLTPMEMKTIDKRNVCLHGDRSLKDGAGVDGYSEEMRRIDILRMVIYKAVLSLLGYEGPYIDYAERPATGEFPVKMMKAGATPAIES